VIIEARQKDTSPNIVGFKREGENITHIIKVTHKVLSHTTNAIWWKHQLKEDAMMMQLL
jgi:hypothetical protein